MSDIDIFNGKGGSDGFNISLTRSDDWDFNPSPALVMNVAAAVDEEKFPLFLNGKGKVKLEVVELLVEEKYCSAAEGGGLWELLDPSASIRECWRNVKFPGPELFGWWRWWPCLKCGAAMVWSCWWWNFWCNSGWNWWSGDEESASVGRWWDEAECWWGCCGPMYAAMLSETDWLTDFLSFNPV